MIHKYLVAAALLGAAAFPVAAQSVHAGIEAWQHADYARAVAIWRPLAEAGDPDAQFNLGQAYRLGRGVPINLGAAQTWFERAAAKGQLDAQTTLGLMLFENGDQSGGARWLKPVAEKGEPRALFIYGLALFNGEGVKRDPILGYAYVSRSAAQGFAPAQASLEELRQLLPVEQRKKALAIAMAQAKTASSAASKPRSQVQARKPMQTTVAISLPKVAPPPLEIRAKGAVPPTAAGGWRAQLGAFSRRGAAEALFDKLSKGGALGGAGAFYIAAGPVTRLQVGPFPSRTAAQALCNGLKGQACFPVPAK